MPRLAPDLVAKNLRCVVAIWQNGDSFLRLVGSVGRASQPEMRP